jgi:hypothetical protein
VLRAVPEVLLEPDARKRAQADETVELDLAAEVHRQPAAVRVPADEVVEPEREREREPVDRNADREPSQPPHARDRQGEEAAEHERHEHVP